METLMGTWSTLPFGNDAAGDWAERLIKTDDLSYIEETLRVVFDCKESVLSSDTAEEAVAAAEVLAKLLGHGSQADGYTAAVDKWIRSHPATPSASLLDQARQALDRIRKDPWMQGAWFDAAQAAQWAQSLRSIQANLQTA
jgi:hypothetical protein